LNSLKGQSRMLFPRVLVIVVLASALTQSCSWLGASEDAYLQAGSVSRTKIPESLDEPIYDDAMAIPPIDDARGIAGQKLELGLPEALSTAFGVEQIVIKRIGDNRWVQFGLGFDSFGRHIIWKFRLLTRGEALSSRHGWRLEKVKLMWCIKAWSVVLPGLIQGLLYRTSLG
jgi:hypothetical protein